MTKNGTPTDGCVDVWWGGGGEGRRVRGIPPFWPLFAIQFFTGAHKRATWRLEIEHIEQSNILEAQMGQWNKRAPCVQLRAAQCAARVSWHSKTIVAFFSFGAIACLGGYGQRNVPGCGSRAGSAGPHARWDTMAEFSWARGGPLHQAGKMGRVAATAQVDLDRPSMLKARSLDGPQKTNARHNSSSMGRNSPSLVSVEKNVNGTNPSSMSKHHRFNCSVKDTFRTCSRATEHVRYFGGKGGTHAA